MTRSSLVLSFFVASVAFLLINNLAGSRGVCTCGCGNSLTVLSTSVNDAMMSQSDDDVEEDANEQDVDSAEELEEGNAGEKSGEEMTCKPVARPERRPELLHVRKTGGSTLEIMAAAHNVSWSTCHWRHIVNGMVTGQRCPPNPRHANALSHNMRKQSRTFVWHLPPKYLDSKDNFFLDNASPFIISRNPYDRIVSAWNYKTGGNRTRSRDPKLMNEFIIKNCKTLIENRPRHGGLPSYDYFGAEIPQTEYVNDDVYILRLENLEHDFSCMMKQHGMNWPWPKPGDKKDKEAYNKSKEGSLTKANVTTEARRLIAEAYREDFLQLGYSIDED